jgi:acetoin utilization protein AcuB
MAIAEPSPVPLPGTVASIMSYPLITLDVGASLEQATARMEGERIHHLLLTDRGLIVAMVSDRNLIQARGIGPAQRDTDSRYRRHPVLQVATFHLVTVDEFCPVEAAAASMLDAGVSALPVVDDDRNVVGILTSRDLLRYVASLGRQSSDAELRRAS